METKVLEPKVLAANMGLSPKRLRALLRAEYPRSLETKGKRWEIPAELATKVETEYKAKKIASEAKKAADIKAQLEGKPKAEVAVIAPPPVIIQAPAYEVVMPDMSKLDLTIGPGEPSPEVTPKHVTSKRK